MNKLNVRWSKFVKSITIILAITLVPTLIFLAAVSLNSWISISVFTVVLLLLVYFTCMAPLFVFVNENQLTLKKLLGKITFRFDEIERIEIYENGVRKDARLFGSGGFFGFLGKFYSTELGHFQAYIGDYSQTFSIEMKTGKKYILSCENRDMVVSLFKNKIER